MRAMVAVSKKRQREREASASPEEDSKMTFLAVEEKCLASSRTPSPVDQNNRNGGQRSRE
jgi:hypothetical protein